MSSTDAIPFLISALLLVSSFLIYYFDQKKFKQQMEDDMQDWFEKEYKKKIHPLDRRGSRTGGRRAYDIQ